MDVATHWKAALTGEPESAALRDAGATPVRDIPRDAVTGLILAGGRAARMGGLDKGLQRLGGVPLVMHVLRRFAPQVGEVIISANRNFSEYRSFGVPVRPDSDPAAFDGPLAGILAGLRHCRTPYLLVAPCDCPMIPPGFAAGMARRLLWDNADLVLARIAGRTHPVLCMMRTRVLSSLQRFLESGGRSVYGWSDCLSTTFADFEDPLPFFNLNTLDDLRLAESVLGGSQPVIASEAARAPGEKL